MHTEASVAGLSTIGNIAFEPYEGIPGSAYAGFKLHDAAKLYPSNHQDSRSYQGNLICACEVLFQRTSFTMFRMICFVRLSEGKLTFEEEDLLKSLGIKF